MNSHKFISNKDLWIKGVFITLKVNRFWASSVGFNQFSYVITNSAAKSKLRELPTATWQDMKGTVV